MVSSAKSEGAGLVERTGERRLWDSGGVLLDLGKRSRSGEETRRRGGGSQRHSQTLTVWSTLPVTT